MILIQLQKFCSIKSNSVTRIENLRSLIGSWPEGEKVMTAIKGSIFDQMLRGATQREDLSRKTLKRAFYGLPDGVRKALWRDELPEMEKLVDNLNKDPQKMLRQGLVLVPSLPLACIGLTRGTIHLRCLSVRLDYISLQS